MTSQNDAYFAHALREIENGHTLNPRLRAVLTSADAGPVPFGASLPGFTGDDRRALAVYALAVHDRAETLKSHVLEWLRGESTPPADEQERILQRVLDLRGKPSEAIREAGDLGLSADWGHVAEALRRCWKPTSKKAA